jgi:methionine-rich copper-binding protein CopC
MRSVCLALIAWVALAGAVNAHTHLEGSVPAADATVAPPSEIKLTFSEPVEAALSHIGVKSKTGEVVEAPKVAADPANKAVLILALAKPLAPGSYTVDWRVVSADTHKMHGTFSFEVKP